MQQFQIGHDKKTGMIIAQKEFFERDCLLQIASENSHKFYIDFEFDNTDYTKINIKTKDNSILHEYMLRDFMNALIDMQVQLNLDKENKTIREKIVEQAFSPIKR